MKLYAIAMTFVALAFGITSSWFGHDAHQSSVHGWALERALLKCGQRETSLKAACRMPDAAMVAEIDRCHEVLRVADGCCQLCADHVGLP